MSTALMQLTCQADNSQYASMRDHKRFQSLGLEQLGYSPVAEGNSFGLSMVGVIAWDVGIVPELLTFWMGEYMRPKLQSVK